MKPRKRIASISEEKRASVAAYNREARRVVVLAREHGLICPVSLKVFRVEVHVEEIHHLRGKGCEALRHDKRGWMLINRLGHFWAGNNRKKARELGFLCPLGKWGTPFKPGEPPMPGSVASWKNWERAEF